MCWAVKWAALLVDKKDASKVVLSAVLWVDQTVPWLAARSAVCWVVMMDTCSATKDVKIGKGFTWL